MRVNAETDIQRLREQLAEEMSTSRREIDTLRKALDDMHFRSEEAIRAINVKNEEIEGLLDKIDNLGKIIEAKHEDIVDLRGNVAQLEMKNRKLNDVVNKVLYGQTEENINKTIDIFKKNPKLAKDPRMEEIMYKKPLTVENAY